MHKVTQKPRAILKPKRIARKAGEQPKQRYPLKPAPFQRHG